MTAKATELREGGKNGSWKVLTALVLVGTAVVLRSAEGTREAAGSPGAAPVSPGAVMPVGSIVAFGGPATAVPEAQGWLLCDGRELPAGVFPELFAVLGGAWGRDAAGARFRLPDLRGRFVRGVNYDAPEGYRDPDRLTREASADGGNTGNEVGSIQGDQVGPHPHPLVGVGDAVGAGGEQGWVRLFATKLPDEAAPLVTSQGSVQPGPGLETRPRNVAVNWIIRAR